MCFQVNVVNHNGFFINQLFLHIKPPQLSDLKQQFMCLVIFVGWDLGWTQELLLVLMWITHVSMLRYQIVLDLAGQEWPQLGCLAYLCSSGQLVHHMVATWGPKRADRSMQGHLRLQFDTDALSLAIALAKASHRPAQFKEWGSKLHLLMGAVTEWHFRGHRHRGNYDFCNLLHYILFSFVIFLNIKISVLLAKNNILQILILLIHVLSIFTTMLSIMPF